LNEDPSVHACQVCGSNRATHLCEDCGEILCLDCMETKSSVHYVCSNCHHALGTPPPGEKFERCPECDSRELSLGKRLEEICPRCHSARTTPIEERRRALAQDMRRAIMSIQYGHIRLRDFTNRLATAKRLLVSLRMANFLHYRWLEDKIDDIQTELPAIKNRVANQAEIIARQMTAETKGFLDYNTWSAVQFPFIGGVTNRITELGNQYRRNVDEALETVRLTISDLEQQLDGLDYYRKQFAGFYETAELSVNELPVCALPEIRIAGSDFLKNDKALGTLYITNRRLVFMAETGRLRKKTDIIFDFPLMYLKSIEGDGRLRKRVVLRMKQGDVKLSCNEQTEKVLPDYVEIARKFDKYMQSDLQRTRKLGQSDVTISDVRLKIENLVYSLISSGGAGDQGRDTTQTIGAFPKQMGQYAGGTQFRRDFQQSSRPHLRDRLRRDLEGMFENRGQPHGPNSSNSGMSSSDMLVINDAINDTVHLFRSGQLVPEDFIRRYKGLMRDSYDTRRRLESASRYGQSVER